MLFQDTVYGHVDKVQKAIARLKTMEPRDGSGYYLAFSGGKDSQCVYHLAKMAGVKFDAHYSVTSIDPPELMRFIKKEYPDVIWEYPIGDDGKPTSMWKIISEHTIPPTRQSRYCCDILKEQHGQGRVTVTGVRWAESIRRRDSHGVVDVRTSSKKIINDQLENNEAAQLNSHGNLIFMDDNEETRRMVETCFKKKRTTVNPIVDWGDDDVWEFLNEVAKVPHCCLYDEGFTRLGCIGCPLQGREGMLRDFERWPRYKELYIRAFDKMIANHPGEIRVASGAPVGDGGGYCDIHRMDLLECLTNENLSKIPQIQATQLRKRERGIADGDRCPEPKSGIGSSECNLIDTVQEGLPLVDQSETQVNSGGSRMLQFWLHMHRPPNSIDPPFVW